MRNFGLSERAKAGAPATACAGATIDRSRLEHQAARAAVQPEIPVGDAKVVRDNRLAFDIACRLEIGECLMQELQLGGEIGLVEHQHVARIARAVQVAGLPGTAPTRRWPPGPTRRRALGCC